ncbi:unnamed protein product [Adineta ricciae]|uniref:Glucuronosyltransferase n=1 Tax=Adineta ricciae TaxID=249248 RepID=A0A815FVW8_ADIRI|nr:unnamed protein product [Adineta ricciae]
MNSGVPLIIGLFLLFTPKSFCLNVLLTSIGHAGHVTPIFELAKSLEHHNITFVTQPLAQSYVNFNYFSKTSSFRLIYTNDSIDAFIAEKQKEQQLIDFAANHGFFDNMGYTTELLNGDVNSLYNKIIHLLMNEKFDVIIANSLIKGIHALSKQANTSCVVQSTESIPNMLDFNLPNIFSLLSKEQMTRIKYRIYNVIYTLRLGIILITKILPTAGKISKSLPQVPGPFYDSLSLKNILLTETQCLELFNIPPTFYTQSYTNHYTKYLGAFIDEQGIEYTENELSTWVRSKANKSIIYAAFGTSSLIKFNRMQNLINGLAEFLLKNPNCFLLLVLRGINYESYQMVLNEMKNEEYQNIFKDSQRVRIETGFVQQKWILQENSIKLFLSHCGMGSCSEGIYFQKPILCMPFNMDQFINGNSIVQLGIGLSLFIPPSLFQSLLRPYDFYDYNFTSDSVTRKLSEIWENSNYQHMIRIMSLEMKHAGGVKQAVKEIEFLVNLNGNLDRYAPFQSTLVFYQRYLLDLIIIIIILPMTIVVYGLIKCCKRRQKEKRD